ncbi:MAG: 50S ribosomal protein L11 methyltransferase [Thermodesulfobacteriota bacterium]
MTEKMEDGKPKWIEVLVEHPALLAEAVSSFLFDLGASALAQEEGAEPGETLRSRAGFLADRMPAGAAGRLEAFLADLPGLFGLTKVPQALWRPVQPGDWTVKWKAGLEPFEIGRFLVVKPTWCDYRASAGRRVIELDPGLAFGTGRHASTYLCLELLDDTFQTSPSLPARVLDVGAGSGILALAAAALGAGLVLALDNDPEVMPVAAENTAHNGLAGRVLLVCGEPAAVRGPFDLVLANLTQGTLLELQADLTRLTRPGGGLILSGLLIEQAGLIERNYLAAGFGLIRKTEREEWAALHLRRLLTAGQAVSQP